MSSRTIKTHELFVEFKDRQIVDQDGNRVSVARAKQLWETGRVSNYNLAFKRLATQAG